MADAIRVRLKVLAEYASTPVRARDRHVRETMAMLRSDYEPARDYWKQPREAIRNAVGSRRSRQTLLGVEFKSADPRRLKNYEAARTEFVSWFDLYQPESTWSPRARELRLGDVLVVVNPDFAFQPGWFPRERIRRDRLRCPGYPNRSSSRSARASRSSSNREP